MRRHSLLVHVVVVIALLWGPGRTLADEVDVSGAWQVNLDCGAYAKATNAFSFTEEVSTGVIATQPTATCGTVAFSHY
jgi:hypothetical protein